MMNGLSLWLVLCFIQVSLQVENIPINYLVTPPTTYEGGIFISDCDLGNNRNLTRCPSNVRLTNNVTNEGVTFDVANFMGWNDSFSLEFNFGSRSFTFTQVNIYFYNNPSAGYGLPAIRTSVSFSGTEVDDAIIEYSFTDNSEFSQTDDQVLVIPLIITTSPGTLSEYQFFRLNFDFTSYQITQTFLSELTFFSGTSTNVDNSPIEFTIPYQSLQYGPSTLQSSIQLNCTIANNGSFSWSSWTGPAVTSGKTKAFYADTTRTSILSINRLSSDDNGTYTCTAEYSNSEFTKHRTSTTISLTLDGMVSTNSPVTVQSSNSARLQCIFTGYLPTYYEIIWTDMTGSPINDSLDQYDIDEREGQGQSQRGGDNLESGIVSELTIMSPTTDDEGVYTCSINGGTLIGTIQLFVPVASTSTLVITIPSTTPSTTPPSTPTDRSSGGVSGAVIGGAIAGVILLILILIVFVLIVIFVMMSRRTGSKKLPNDLDELGDPLYTEVAKPSLPPLPSRFVNSGYASIDLPGNGHPYPMSELSGSPRARSPPQSSPDHPKPAQLTLRPDFLQNNPMYASAENIDRMPPNFGLRPTGSLPFLDSSDTFDMDSEFNIYAKPSIEPPPVPPYRGTPDPEEGIFTEEGFNPSLFKQSSMDSNKISFHGYYSVYSNPKPLQRSDGLLHVKEKNIRIIKELGMGQFGEVVLAYTVGLTLQQLKLSESNTDTISLMVAVKKLKSDADDKMREAFEKEVKFMARLKHENVVRLLGVCLSSNAFIMMEYMESGDLNHYLRDKDLITAESYPLPDNAVTVPVLVYMCLQIARGMHYLASLRFIHRDLATRNILVGQDYKVKIADFGMSQNLYSDFYYRIQGRAILPIRWMANECFYGRFSEKTDVWAFGVLVWEIFTLCKQQPYEHLSDQEVIDDAVRGEGRMLLSQPEPCPNEVYHVMLRCWSHSPDDRASFEEIYNLLSNIHAYNEMS